MFFIH